MGPGKRISAVFVIMEMRVGVSQWEW